MVGDFELFLRVSFEIRVFGNRNIRWIEKHEIVWFRVFGQYGGVISADDCGFPECLGSLTQGLRVADFRVLVFSEWSVELSFAVDSIQAVETGLVQIDCSCRGVDRR